MNAACDYAACTRLATVEADGWNFCRDHIREHRALKIDDFYPPLPNRRWRSKFDVDVIAVERAVQGRPPEDLTRAERLLAVQCLLNRGVGTRLIAQTLQIHRRQADRDVADLRKQAS